MRERARGPNLIHACCVQGKLVRYQPRQGRYKIKLEDGKEVDLALPHDCVKLLPEDGDEQPKKGRKSKN